MDVMAAGNPSKPAVAPLTNMFTTLPKSASMPANMFVPSGNISLLHLGPSSTFGRFLTVYACSSVVHFLPRQSLLFDTIPHPVKPSSFRPSSLPSPLCSNSNHPPSYVVFLSSHHMPMPSQPPFWTFIDIYPQFKLSLFNPGVMIWDELVITPATSLLANQHIAFESEMYVNMQGLRCPLGQCQHARAALPPWSIGFSFLFHVSRNVIDFMAADGVVVSAMAIFRLVDNLSLLLKHQIGSLT